MNKNYTSLDPGVKNNVITDLSLSYPPHRKKIKVVCPSVAIIIDE